MEDESKKRNYPVKGTLAYEHFMAYQRKYKKEHYGENAVIAITVSRSKDKDILDYRNGFDRTWNSHMKELIREDMKKNGR